MESLYTKYRPQTFEQVVGQKHIVSTLMRAVLEQKLSHAYLFCGPRGTGKTTMARLLAKAILCQDAPGHLPDGTCEECQLIAAGQHPDVFEIDAASNTGVDNVREEIISRASYAPVRGKGKVYIIDEVHMLTSAAFNALLKTLEEPPSHVTFIMCTTDPQKILATILSRVQRFDFRSIASDEMADHLAQVCKSEGFTFEPAAIDLIVRHAHGGMRDALSSLEQVSVYGGGVISEQTVRDVLGQSSGSLINQSALALAQRDISTLFTTVDTLFESGKDMLQFTRELAVHIRDLYVAAAVGTDSPALANTTASTEQLTQEVQAFGSADRLSRVLTILGDAANQMRTAANQRLVLEVAFTKLARPNTDLSLSALADRVAVLELQLENIAAVSYGEKPVEVSAAVAPAAVAPAAVAPAAVAPAIAAASSQTQASEPKSSSLSSASNVTPVQESVSKPIEMAASESTSHVSSASVASSAPTAPAIPAVSTTSIATSTSSPQSAPAPAEMSQQTIDQLDARKSEVNQSDALLARQWKDVVRLAVKKNAAHGSLLLNSTLESDDGNILTVTLPVGSSFATKMLGTAAAETLIKACIEQVIGPRSITYVESSLAATSISREERAAHNHVQVPATMKASSVPATTSPSSKQSKTQEAPSVPSYPMPWDEAAPESVLSDAYKSEQVPYSDVDVASVDEQTSDQAHITPTASEPASVSTATPKPEARPSSEEDIASRSELPKELNSVASMLEEVFGPAISVSIQKKPDAEDEAQQ